MRPPLVSIIVPTYNTGKRLSLCLDSLVNQSYKNFEIIICDDFTTDETTKVIIQEYRDNYPGLVFYLVPEIKGANYAREAGIKQARGEYLTFIDSDDTLVLDAIERLVENIIHYQSDIVIGKLIRVGFDGEIIKSNIIPMPEKPYIDISSEEIIKYASFLKPTLCGKLYKKYIFKNVPIENPPYYQDWNITYKILIKANSLSFLNKNIYLYTYDLNSFSSGSTKENQDKIYDAWISIDGIIEYFNKNDLLQKYDAWIKYIAFNFLISLIGRSYYLKSIRARKKIHKDCITYWRNNFKASHYEVDQKWFWKVSLSNFMFSELIRLYYMTRKKISKNYY